MAHRSASLLHLEHWVCEHIADIVMIISTKSATRLKRSDFKENDFAASHQYPRHLASKKRPSDQI